MTREINQWAQRWKVPYGAILELQGIFGISAENPKLSSQTSVSEAHVQSLVRLEASRKGLKLWRNNVGVLEDVRGVPVRYGLANDSPALNKSIKSGDLIGWRPLVISSAHVGSKIAQFVSRECKRSDWIFTGSEREVAQLKWAQALIADGGDACFVKGEGTL